ncbi:MAG: CehA/McbA family metallohydrolase [Pseudomonadota bacterium]
MRIASFCCLALCVACGDEKVQSPKEGELLRGDWVPVAVQLPNTWSTTAIHMTLDGVSVDDPLGAIRKRKGNKREPGAQYLALLDLSAVPAGEHELRVRFERPWRLPTTVSSRFVTQPRPLRLGLHLDDGAGRPVDARVLIVGEQGPLRVLDAAGWRYDPRHRDAALTAVYSVDGEAAVRLEPGHYRIVATRGIRDAVAVEAIDLDDDTDLSLSLPRLVPTPGAVAMDMHVHTGLSYDAYTPARARAWDLAASGLDAVVLADHNRVAHPEALQAAMGSAAAVPRLIAGIEADLRSHEEKNWDIGHVTAWPVVGPAAPPSRYPQSVAQGFAAWRRRQERHPDPVTGAEVLLTLAHPRGILFQPGERSKDQAWALFNHEGFDRDVPVGEGNNAWMTAAAPDGSMPLAFDALEVVNRMGWAKAQEVRADWFALLNQGYAITGVGNSDSHAIAVEQVGWPRNLVQGGLDDAGGLDLAGLLEAVRAGRLQVSTGPVIDLRVLAAGGEAGPGDLVATGGEPVQVEVRVRAAPWVPVRELRLVRDGEVIERVAIDFSGEGEGPPLDWAARFELPVPRDGWVLAEAGWPLDGGQGPVGGLYGLIAPDYVPFAFTNPVRLDADGDGAWGPTRRETRP